MRWKHLPIVAFDTETTGLNPFLGDRIIEFAAVVYRLGPDGAVADREDHQYLFDPGIPIPKETQEITGITDRDVKGKPPFSHHADRVRALLADAITVAHNYAFDVAFLTQELKAAGLSWPEPLAEVDTWDISRKHFPEERGHKLVEFARRMGIPLEGAHRATNDAAACGLCFIELARRRNVEDDLQAMLDWAMAVGRPPEEGPLCTDENQRVIFREGPHAGEPAAEHPIHLAWMEKARVRNPEGWDWRFPESTRRWIRRWLDVRGCDRFRPNPKSFRTEDWVLDSCIADGSTAP